MTVFSRLLGAMICAGAIAASAMAATGFVLERELDTRSDMTCTSETAFGNFVADAVRKSRSADIGIVSCTAIHGNRTYAKGDTFDGTAAGLEIAPEAKVVTIEVTGTQLLDALEQAVATAPASSPSFVQVAGIRMVVDLKKGAGARIVKLTSNGAALDFAQTYKVAITEDAVKALAPLAGAKRLDGEATAAAADVTAHLQDVGVRDIKVLGRIKLLQ